ncbi:MAG: DMT family transporter [Candidatus Thorarchaeota archaeon]
MTEKPYKYYAMLIIAMAFWGGSWVSAKFTVSLAPPMTIGFFRFFIASILFLIIILVAEPESRRFFRRENMKLLFLVGITGIFGYGVLFLVGMQFTTAAQGSIIAGFNPATVSIVAHIVHKERLKKKWQYIGFAFAFAGIIFVVGIQAIIDFQINYLIGNVIILGAMMTWGIYSSVGKEAMKTMSPLEVNTGGVLVGAIIFGIGALFEQIWTLPALVDPFFWMNTIYLGAFVTVVGFLFYFISIKELGATRAGGFINLVPVFGTFFSAIFMPEDPIYWTFGVGLLLVICGISIINFPINEEEFDKPTQTEEK